MPIEPTSGPRAWMQTGHVALKDAAMLPVEEAESRLRNWMAELGPGQKVMICNDLQTLLYERHKASKYIDTVSRVHARLTAAGVADATGTVCDDDACQSKLEHRTHDLIEQRDALLAAVAAYLSASDLVRLYQRDDYARANAALDRRADAVEAMKAAVVKAKGEKR